MLSHRSYLFVLLNALLLAMLLGATPPRAFAATTIIYVKPGGTGDGSSWGTAANLTPALISGAATPAEIWVAAGTYTPTSGTDRTATFTLKTDVAIYGGFAGTETNLGQRNWVSNVVTLSGAIGAASTSDNSHHVVTGTTGAILDGVTITGGNATGTGAATDGGGMYNGDSNPTLTNVTFSDNTAEFHGGGMHNFRSNPVLTNVTFRNNSANDGGGMSNGWGSAPILTNVTFSGNTASRYGGALLNSSSSPVLTNVIFSGNYAVIAGGGIFNGDSSPVLTNTTFNGNSTLYRPFLPPNGRGIHNSGASHPTVRNSIIWDGAVAGIVEIGSTTTISSSIIQGGASGPGNLAVDPLFVADGDLRLRSSSPAINAGDTAGIPVGVTTDRAGNPRVIGGQVDMGAYEALPAVAAITRADPNPTEAVSVAFTVTFNMPVTGVSAAAFHLSASGDQSGASITSVTGSGAIWTVTVATVPTALGRIRLDLHDDDTITATTGAPPNSTIPLGGAGVGNGDFTDGQEYMIGYTIHLPLIVR